MVEAAAMRTERGVRHWDIGTLDIGVEGSASDRPGDLHFVLEGDERFGVERLAEELLDGDGHAAAHAAVHVSEAPAPDALAPLDLARPNRHRPHRLERHYATRTTRTTRTTAATTRHCLALLFTGCTAAGDGDNKQEWLLLFVVFLLVVVVAAVPVVPAPIAVESDT
jgi:hypothetical protein